MITEYTAITTRIKAVIIDTIAIIVLMYAAAEIFNVFENIPNYIRISVFVSLFILYEPVLVSLFGATLGHFLKILL